MAFGKKNNWDIVQGQDAKDKLKYLDVHGRQQMERGTLAEKKSMTTYNILNGVLCAFVFLLVWILVSLWDMTGTGKGELELSLNPADSWFHVNEHYVNVDNPEDKITVEEYNALVATFAKAKPLPEVKDPGAPPVYENPEDAYRFAIEGHRDKPWYNETENVRLSNDEFETLKANYESVYATRMAQYEKDLADYRAYRASVDNPADQYKSQKEHYRNGFNPEEYVLPDAYAKMVEEYDKLVRRGKLTDDEANIPPQPLKMTQFYVASDYGIVPVKGSLDGSGTQQWSVPSGGSSGDSQNNGPNDAAGGPGDETNGNPEENTDVSGEGTTEATEEPVMGLESEGQDNPAQGQGEQSGSGQEAVSPEDISPRDLYQFDIVGHRDAPWRNKETGEYITNEQMEALCNAWDAFHGDGQATDGSVNAMPDEPVLDVRDVESDVPTDVPEGMEYGPIEYRNIYDGSVITYLEYNEMEAAYKEAVEAYKEVYMAHRQQYHPDDVDGTKKIFSMRPTVMKFLISFAISGLAFGIMYAIFSKQLKAENMMSDTSDINQYYHDQHVALPEEVQRNYDWFPDVGAHSAVQVSSMISHMALFNKGLKKVMLARRADKDIRDENGDIDYYKGEILMDADGNVIADEKPIIDEQFMEDLFDASGALKDKEVRVRYDATKIPYNPDGSNRDKLGKYATVADLINDDWEFPIYEPQRPAGAYIVDTAPVNTMVWVTALHAA